MRAAVWTNLALFPMPAGVHPSDPEAFRAHVATLPPAAFLLPFLAHFAQVVVGGLVASKLGKAPPRTLVGIIGVLTVMGSVTTNLQIAPPAWTWIELPLYLPVIWGTIRLAERMCAPVMVVCSASMPVSVPSCASTCSRNCANASLLPSVATIWASIRSQSASISRS